MKFSATARSVQGSSASRRLRRAGRVPAIVYGGTAAPLNIELDHNEIYHALRKESFHASILTLEVAGGQNEQVLLRSVQWHPCTQHVLHVDERFALTAEIGRTWTAVERIRLEGADVEAAVARVDAFMLEAGTVRASWWLSEHSTPGDVEE